MQQQQHDAAHVHTHASEGNKFDKPIPVSTNMFAANGEVADDNQRFRQNSSTKARFEHKDKG